MTTNQTLAPADMLALVNEAAQARPIAATVDRRKLGQLMHMAADLDQRGLEAVINCAAFHSRYPKEGK